MTFVSIIAREHFISICSDGRMMCDGVPSGEDACKFHLTRHGFVAYGGQQGAIGALLVESGLLLTDLSDPRLYVDRVHTLITSPAYGDMRVLLCFGGRSRAGSTIISLSTLEPEPQVWAPIDEQMAFSFLYNSQAVEDAVLQQHLAQYVHEEGFATPAQIQKAQWRLQMFVADRDPTVNRRVFSAALA